MRSKADYERVFQPSTKGRKRHAVGAAPAPGAGGDDVVTFVEEQVRAITAAVKLMAGPQPQDMTAEELEARPVDQWCPQCTTDQPHLHRSKLFLRGKEQF